MSAVIIPFPRVNQRTGQSPKLRDLVPKREVQPEWLKKLRKNFGGAK